MKNKSPNESLGRRNSMNQRSSTASATADDADNQGTRETEDRSSMSDDQDNVPEPDGEDDAESMEDDQSESGYRLICLQQEATKKLSRIFKLLDIAPIHDKSVILMTICKFMISLFL
jgi:hypothetical protein